MKTERKATMTRAEATSFGRYSVANASAVETALPCGCKAYTDVFTYRRWQAQGYQVRRGEHGVHIPVIIRVTDEEEGEEASYKLRRASSVFCRHQVERLAAGPGATPRPTAPQRPVVAPSPGPDAVSAVMKTWKEV